MGDDLFQKVKGLNLPKGKYVLFGSAPLCIRGLRKCNDIDIVVDREIWDGYKDKPDWQLKKTGVGQEEIDCLFKQNIEMVKDWKPGIWDIRALIEEAEMIDGLPFVKLEKLLEYKKLCTREKDLKDIAIIEDFLKNNSGN